MVHLDETMRDSLYNYNGFNPKYLKEKLIEDSIYKFEYNLPRETTFYSKGYYDKKYDKNIGWWEIRYGVYKEKFQVSHEDEKKANQFLVYFEEELDTIRSYYADLERVNDMILINYYMHTNGKDSLMVEYFINDKQYEPLLIGRERFKTTIQIPYKSNKKKLKFYAILTNLIKEGNYIYSSKMVVLDSL
jgi:hypothetical protein